MKKLTTVVENTFYFNKAVEKTQSQCTRHYHGSVEIYYLISGNCSYFIDNRSYELEAGDMVLIPEGVIHRTNYNENEEHSRYLINCTANYIPRSVLPIIAKTVCLYRAGATTERARDIFMRIEEEHENKDEYQDEALRALSCELFLLLARNISQNASKAKSAASPFVEAAVEYIQKNYASEISLSHLAKMQSVSAEHLSRVFKKQTGFGFSEYLTLVRLQRAEYMLKNEPGKSISEVAYACGFNDSNYFSDKFKKAYGYPPTKEKRRI